MSATNEPIPFRLLLMSCCSILICWVNPRRPNYCPECGKFCLQEFPKDQWQARFAKAWLRIEAPPEPWRKE